MSGVQRPCLHCLLRQAIKSWADEHAPYGVQAAELLEPIGRLAADVIGQGQTVEVRGAFLLDFVGHVSVAVAQLPPPVPHSGRRGQ